MTVEFQASSVTFAEEQMVEGICLKKKHVCSY